MAILIDVDGTETTVSPANPKKGFTLDEMYKLIGCELVELIPLPHNQEMWVDEEGKIKGAPINRKATQVFQAAIGAFDAIVGKALICKKGEVR